MNFVAKRREIGGLTYLYLHIDGRCFGRVLAPTGRRGMPKGWAYWDETCEARGIRVRGAVNLLGRDATVDRVLRAVKAAYLAHQGPQLRLAA